MHEARDVVSSQNRDFGVLVIHSWKKVLRGMSSPRCLSPLSALRFRFFSYFLSIPRTHAHTHNPLATCLSPSPSSSHRPSHSIPFALSISLISLSFPYLLACLPLPSILLSSLPLHLQPPPHPLSSSRAMRSGVWTDLVRGAPLWVSLVAYLIFAKCQLNIRGGGGRAVL